MENWSASLTTVLAKPIGHITADSENACKATFVLCIGYAHLPIYVVQNSPPNSQNQMFYKQQTGGCAERQREQEQKHVSLGGHVEGRKFRPTIITKGNSDIEVSATLVAWRNHESNI
ncbi:hypothetical protein GGP41_004751 [Bipolaris sorokiniana]|uniref:Uncharacterized protein n=1 Tax=Cochliobolus sativus TaxID=45130 RepID=A0A8H6DUD5_COCSA|nr:hypothetical protein GGP41_004751 [Bipolaris sorokiniana]